MEMDLSNLPHHYLGGYFRNLVLPQPPHTRRRKRSYILPPTHNMHNTQNTDCVKKYRVDVSQIFQVCLSTEIQHNGFIRIWIFKKENCRLEILNDENYLSRSHYHLPILGISSFTHLVLKIVELKVWIPPALRL